MKPDKYLQGAGTLYSPKPHTLICNRNIWTHSYNQKSLQCIVQITDEQIWLLAVVRWLQSKSCHIDKNHSVGTAALCSSCFEKEVMSTSHCHHTIHHCGPVVFWITKTLDTKKKECHNVMLAYKIYNITSETNIPVDQTSSLAHLRPRCIQDYTNIYR